jgi:hypothetical protein
MCVCRLRSEVVRLDSEVRSVAAETQRRADAELEQSVLQVCCVGHRSDEC